MTLAVYLMTMKREDLRALCHLAKIKAGRNKGDSARSLAENAEKWLPRITDKIA